MIYILLAIIAVGVFLISKDGRKLLKWIGYIIGIIAYLLIDGLFLVKTSRFYIEKNVWGSLLFFGVLALSLLVIKVFLNGCLHFMKERWKLSFNSSTLLLTFMFMAIIGLICGAMSLFGFDFSN